MDGRSPLFGIELASHQKWLVAFARKRGLPRADAEDAASETVCKAWEARERFDGENIKAWLFTILRNVIASAGRYSQRHPTCSTEDIEWRHPPALDSAYDALLLKQTLKAMLAIAPQHLDPMILLARGVSHEDAGEAIGAPVGTIKSRVARGRRELEEMTA